MCQWTGQSIGSGNGSSLVGRSTITWTNADLLSIVPNSNALNQETTLENVVCETAAILSMG